MADTSARASIARLAFVVCIAACRADGPSAPVPRASASAGGSASTTAPRDAAPRETPEERAARLLADRVGALVPLENDRFAAIVLHLAEKRVEVAIAEANDADARIAARIELPTSGLWIASDPAELAVVAVSARDADGDGATDLALVLGYPTEPACGVATARVEHFFLVGGEGRVCAAVQLGYLPGSDQVGSRRASATWSGRDLVITGEECGAKHFDAGACAPFEERHRFDAATGTWGRAPAPVRVPAFDRPCAR